MVEVFYFAIPCYFYSSVLSQKLSCKAIYRKFIRPGNTSLSTIPVNRWQCLLFFGVTLKPQKKDFALSVNGLRARGGGQSQKNWVGVCGPLPKNPTLFMTKICDIPYPIYDLAKNSKPYL